MTLPVLAAVFSLALLVWSAGRFIDGAAAVAQRFGIPPLLIGMVLVGFGTSAPEMTVSAFAASGGNAGIALGNAYGSNIANIALILGLCALVRPITVHSRVLKQELPLLTAATALTIGLLWDGTLTRFDAWVLLLAFAGLMAWTIREGLARRSDALGTEVEETLRAHRSPAGRATFRLVIGLLLLILSSRLLVWSAVEIAGGLGVSDLIIGLTVVAVGTSLPELASSILAARKGEDDLALGNILGSNLFNTLAVVGIAGAIRELGTGGEVLSRDLPVMAFLTLGLFVVCYGFRGPGRISRLDGALLLATFIGYTLFLVTTA